MKKFGILLVVLLAFVASTLELDAVKMGDGDIIYIGSRQNTVNLAVTVPSGYLEDNNKLSIPLQISLQSTDDDVLLFSQEITTNYFILPDLPKGQYVLSIDFYAYTHKEVIHL